MSDVRRQARAAHPKTGKRKEPFRPYVEGENVCVRSLFFFDDYRQLGIYNNSASRQKSSEGPFWGLGVL